MEENKLQRTVSKLHLKFYLLLFPFLNWGSADQWFLCQFYTEVLDPKITKSATSIKEQGISKINQKHG